MKMPALLCATMSGAALAKVVTCDLSGTPVRFNIDRAKFAPALDLAEPQKRRITTVRRCDSQLSAEPILMGAVGGFWAEGLAGSDVMMVMHADRSAIYADTHLGERVTGTCELMQ
jgi:hypothetical protein